MWLLVKANPAQWKKISTVREVTTEFAFLVKLENHDNRKKIVKNGNKMNSENQKKSQFTMQKSSSRLQDFDIVSCND